MGDGKFRQQLFQHVFPLVFVFDHDFKNGLDVVFNAQRTENGGLLRQVADSHPRAAVHRHVGDVLPVDVNVAVIGRDQPGNAVKAGGFAGAVRSQQTDRFAAAHV